MSRKLTSFSLLFLFCLALSSLNIQAAKYNPPPGSQIPADSIIAAMERGEDVIIDSCEIFGELIKKGTSANPDTINGHVTIRQSTFHDSVYLRYCYLSQMVDFRATIFKQKVNCQGTIFGDNCSFWGSTFEKNASFLSSVFCGYAHFSAANFSGTVLFQEAQFKEDAVFKHTAFGAYSSFLQTDFGGKVELSPREFKYIKQISWKQLDDHLNYNHEANYALIRYFEERRMLDDADGVYLFLKDQERMEKPWYIRYPEYWLIQLTCGYGVQPWNTFCLIVGLVFSFALFYFKTSGIRSRMGVKRASFSDALYFSFQTFIIGVVSDWHPKDQFVIKIKKVGIKFRTICMIEGALGWILVILFIISLGRKFIR